MSEGSEFQMCGATTKNAHQARASSVDVVGTDNSGVLDDHRAWKGTAVWISCRGMLALRMRAH